MNLERSRLNAEVRSNQGAVLPASGFQSCTVALTAPGAGKSPYGVWGALGTRASSEILSDF